MTTICYRDGILAADSRTSIGQTVVAGRATKVRRLTDGRLVAFCGATAEGQRFIRWLEEGEEESRAPSIANATVIVVEPKGAIRVHEAGGWFPASKSKFHAWGSGMAAALGALHVGASAVEAVKAATLVDPYSGGTVHSVRLNPPRKRQSSPRK